MTLPKPPLPGEEEAYKGRPVPETNTGFFAMVAGSVVLKWNDFKAYLRSKRESPRPKKARKTKEERRQERAERKLQRKNQPKTRYRWRMMKRWRHFSAWCWHWRAWLCKVPMGIALLWAAIALLVGANAFLPLTLAGLFLALLLAYQRQPPLAGNWLADPLSEDPLPRTVCLETSLFAEGFQWVADVWTPLEKLSHTDFRGSTQALMLSAAAALTVEQLPEEDRAISGEWLSSLGVRVERYHQRFPVADETLYEGFHGVAVKDGAGQRAYFTGDSRLISRCTRLVDRGRWRPIVQGDRERLERLPEDAIYYATAEITGDGLGKLLLLGCIRPRQAVKPSLEAIAAADRIRAYGFDLRWLPPLRGQPNPVRELGLPYESWDGEAPALRLRPVSDQPPIPRDADKALTGVAAWGERPDLPLRRADGQPAALHLRPAELRPGHAVAAPGGLRAAGAGAVVHGERPGPGADHAGPPRPDPDLRLRARRRRSRKVFHLRLHPG